jgi:hypothetical protein
MSGNQTYLKQEDASLPLIFSVALEYGIRKFQENHRLKLNGEYRPLIYANDVNPFRGKIYTIKKNIGALIDVNKENVIKENRKVKTVSLLECRA